MKRIYTTDKTATTATDEKIKDLEKKLADANKAKADLEAENKKLKSEKVEDTKAVSNAKALTEKAKTDLENLRKERDAAKTEAENLKKELDELKEPTPEESAATEAFEERIFRRLNEKDYDAYDGLLDTIAGASEEAIKIFEKGERKNDAADMVAAIFKRRRK